LKIARSDYGDWGLPGGGKTINYTDHENESLQLVFKNLDEIDIDTINIVHKPLFEDLMSNKKGILSS